MYKHSDRGPVVHLDRSRHGQMINAILSDALDRPVSGNRILDIGCGNGGIAAAFVDTNEVWGVDIEDQRTAGVPSEFVRVSSEELPFPDNSFDLVLSHHVIEHVTDQDLHVSEIHRVLRRSGAAYIATPNRSSPIMSGHVGNDMVLHWPEMRPLFEQHQFEVTAYGWRVVTEPDRFHGQPRVGRFIPAQVARRLQRWYPSHMFVLTPSP